LPRTDTRLVFCNRKLMRTSFFFQHDHQTHMQFCKHWNAYDKKQTQKYHFDLNWTQWLEPLRIQGSLCLLLKMSSSFFYGIL
jgi:hypothetical protein